jgi:hypothetical protein
MLDIFQTKMAYNYQTLDSTESCVSAASVGNTKLVEDSSERLEECRHGFDGDDLGYRQVRKEMNLCITNEEMVNSEVWKQRSHIVEHLSMQAYLGTPGSPSKNLPGPAFQETNL